MSINPRASSLFSVIAPCVVFCVFSFFVAGATSTRNSPPSPPPPSSSSSSSLTSPSVNVSIFIASGDVGNNAFQLVRVDYRNSSSPYTNLGQTLQNWILVQGDATCLDSRTITYYAVLNAADSSGPIYSNTSLFAFDANTGTVKWQMPFPINYTMGALAYEPKLNQVVGLCGELVAGNGTVQGYCGVDVSNSSGTASSSSSSSLTPPQGPHLIADWDWTLMYDPDTRALDPSSHKYYHRLYNTTWMPDYFVTLNSLTGDLLQYTQFFSPEFSGTRVDTTNGQIYSVCNANAGLDLCQVDPVSGNFNPLNVFDRLHESDELFAATALLDPVHQLFLLAVDFAVDGTYNRVVDINPKSPTFATIIANLTFSMNPFLSNAHVLGTPDDVFSHGE